MKKSPHQLRKKSDDKLRIDFHEPKVVRVIMFISPLPITFDAYCENSIFLFYIK